MGLALPVFQVSGVVPEESRAVLTGTVSLTLRGSETWVCDGGVGYLKHGDFLAPGRFRRSNDGWRFELGVPRTGH